LRERISVRSIGGQRIIHIRNLQDPCRQRDLFPFEPVGIS
jgi:hypothetical protein